MVAAPRKQAEVLGLTPAVITAKVGEVAREFGLNAKGRVKNTYHEALGFEWEGAWEIRGDGRNQIAMAQRLHVWLVKLASAKGVRLVAQSGDGFILESEMIYFERGEGTERQVGAFRILEKTQSEGGPEITILVKEGYPGSAAAATSAPPSNRGVRRDPVPAPGRFFRPRTMHAHRDPVFHVRFCLREALLCISPVYRSEVVRLVPPAVLASFQLDGKTGRDLGIGSAISPDQRFLAHTYSGVVDLQTGRLVFPYTVGTGVLATAFSADGQRVAFSDDGGITVFQTGSWRQLARCKRPQEQWGLECHFLPSGELASVDDYGQVCLWNDRTGELLRTVNERVAKSVIFMPPVYVPSEKLFLMQGDPNDQGFLARIHLDGTSQIERDRAVLVQEGVDLRKGWPYPAHPSRPIVPIAYGAKIILLDVRTLQPIDTIIPGTELVTSVSWNHAGTQLAVSESFRVHIYDVALPD